MRHIAFADQVSDPFHVAAPFSRPTTELKVKRHKPLALEVPRDGCNADPGIGAIVGIHEIGDLNGHSARRG
jgi:hypothetical protein